MKNKSIGLKILSFIIVIAFIAGGYLYVDFNGNPLDAIKLNKHSDLYMQENYPDIWQNVHRSQNAYFIKSDISYWDNNKQQYIPVDGTWQVYYEDNNDYFSYMYLVYDRNCNLIYDSCSDRYLKGAMIYAKLEQEYENYIKNIFNEEYRDGVPMHSISAETLAGESHAEAVFMYHNTHISHIEPYSGPVLDITREYTMEELAADYGEIYFRFMDDIYYMPGNGTSPDASKYNNVVDNLYSRCLETRDIVEKYNIPFNNISISHGMFEGIFKIDRRQLFSGDLYQFIYDNYTVI
ncbi:MAG: hypothetical protein E7492_00820 [Ruminococcaceae bacterium]|nr:hypothetical protein [Oscillospiraceae bacterium]